VGEGSFSYVVYKLKLSVPRDLFKRATHEVLHRYSEFHALNDALAKRWGKQVDLPKLPGKRLSLRALSHRQVEERRVLLEEYMQQLLQRINWAAEEHLRAFLQADTWLKPRKTHAATGDGEPVHSTRSGE